MIERTIYTTLKQKMFKGKAIILIGARQVGKTTLFQNLLASQSDVLWLNCDEPDVRHLLTGPTSTRLGRFIGKHQIICIDEAQRVKNIGLTLKLITDQLPDKQLLVTGSSALELSNHINEPLTGRKFEYNLYPLSHEELLNYFGMLESNRLLEEQLIFGTYPDIISNPVDRVELLTQLAGSYLYKDLFNYQQIRKPEILQLLLEALALQLASEVSYYELANTLGVDPETIKRYIDLLEKTFVIFRLRAFSRNLRTELKKSRKIYFVDNGIRNALIRNFNPVSLRSDIGALWENYLVSERMKRNSYAMHFCHNYFWRTRQQQEIDYLEEYNGKLYAWEFKWNKKAKVKFSKTFTRAYPDANLSSVTPDNYENFLSSNSPEPSLMTHEPSAKSYEPSATSHQP